MEREDILFEAFLSKLHIQAHIRSHLVSNILHLSPDNFLVFFTVGVHIRAIVVIGVVGILTLVFWFT
jgi:hypothetical protein